MSELAGNFPIGDFAKPLWGGFRARPLATACWL
ncbi:hypothetical protein AB7M17_005251 [Bradyrhizobium sp. USDA 377]